MPRPPLLLPLLLLAAQVSAQLPPRDHKGRIVYQGRIALPDLTQGQVLHRAMRFARQYMVAPAPPHRKSGWQVDSASYLLQGRGMSQHNLLYYKLVLRAQGGGYEYTLSDFWWRQMAYRKTPTDLRIRPYYFYDPVEPTFKARANYDKQHQPTEGLRQYSLDLTKGVDVVLMELQAEMAKP